MPFMHETQRYYSLSEYMSFVREGHSDLLDRKLEFAHPVDSTIINILESASVKGTVDKAVETMVSTQMGMLLSAGLTVEPKSFPGLYSILRQCCKTLGIAIPHTVITNEMDGINAMATGTDDFSFIAISNLVPKLLSEEEQKFIIAHECGHIALGHVVYHTIGSFIGGLGSMLPVIGPIVANTITLPLNAWSRCSEITADRAGLLCCRDLRTAQLALIKIVSGFTDIKNFDINTYIEQSINSLDNHYIGAFQEFFHSHPLIPKRLKALEYFANSKMYFRLTDQDAPANKTLYDDEVLNKLVNELLKVM